jgi:cephalosporin hydroxylase
MPEELRTAFVEAFWSALSWKDSKWLGRPVTTPPTDLLVYQELIAATRPEWIIETGRRSPGRTLFLASICELLDHGHVVSVGDGNTATPEHPRITYVTEPPYEDSAFAAVREIVGGTPNALVVVASGSGAPRLVREFEGYAPFVAVGSYVVFENTIVNGHPVWPGYGPGPTEAVKRILGKHSDFVGDSSWEKHGLTFNPGGFLRRVK